MMKIYKLFGIKVLEILEDKEDLPVKTKKNPQGAILDVTPAEVKREMEREVLDKYK